MRIAVADFVERIEKAGPDAVVFLYYSGHGAADRTERGENYLIRPRLRWQLVAKHNRLSMDPLTQLRCV